MTKISGFSATELAVHFTDTKNRLAQKRMNVLLSLNFNSDCLPKILSKSIRSFANPQIGIQSECAKRVFASVRPSSVILLLALGSIALN